MKEVKELAEAINNLTATTQKNVRVALMLQKQVIKMSRVSIEQMNALSNTPEITEIIIAYDEMIKEIDQQLEQL